MTDKWLESLLQKVAPTSAQQTASVKTELNVPKEFAELVRVSDADDVAGVPVTKIYDADSDFAEVREPVGEFIEKAQSANFGIPDPPHKDGIFFEKSGDVVWTWHYENGRLVKSECVDPALPGGRLILNEHGEEFAKSSVADLRWDAPIAGASEKHSGAPLAKAEVSSRMFSLLAKLRPDCVDDEATQLEKAAKALDLACFTEIVEDIIERMKQAA